MRNGFSTLNIKSAVHDHSKISDFCTLQTTADFGQLLPIFATELVPGDKFNVNAQLFSRCAPLVVPTYGKAEIKTASFFIPYYQIAKDADAWLSGQKYYRSVATHQRFMTIGDLADFFTDRSGNFGISTIVTGAGAFDLQYKDAAGLIVNKKFTKYGKFVYKVLRNLGYQIPAGIDLMSNSSWLLGPAKNHLSAYPILAFFKAYNDWLFQSQNFNTSNLTSLLYQIKLGNNVSGKFNNGNLLASGLSEMFGALKVLYQNDYITSAWRYPNSPMGSDTTLDNIGYEGNSYNPSPSIFRNNYDVSRQFTAGELTSQSGLSQRTLDFLRRFDDWVRRNNYSGSRDVQQIYSRFGVKTDDFKSHYAYLLDRSTFPLQVGDVTSTADTDNAELGSYAGKGIISSECKTSFESSDYGLLLVVAWIAVKPVYADGFDKMVLRAEPFDYFNPEFDALGPQAISMMEVSERNKDFNYSSSASPSDGVYGFTEKYNDYRIFRDKVSGDFTLYEDSGYDAWHFNRDLSDLRNGGVMIAQSASMMYMDPVESEYNRIFQFTDGHEDSFYLTIGFQIDALRPMKSLNQTADLGDGNKVIERNGNTVQ